MMTFGVVMAMLCAFAYAVVKVRPVRIRAKLLVQRVTAVHYKFESDMGNYEKRSKRYVEQTRHFSEVKRLHKVARVALDEGYTYEQLIEWMREQYPSDLAPGWKWTEGGRQRCMRLLMGRPQPSDYDDFIPRLCSMTRGRNVFSNLKRSGYHALPEHDCTEHVLKEMEEELEHDLELEEIEV